jgi:putative membrane protein insertion efficiency factor
MRAALTTGAVLVLEAYQQLVSPLLGPSICRFHPSCSEYARLAVKRDGLLRGGLKAVSRLLRCTPLQRGGIDFP